MESIEPRLTKALRLGVVQAEARSFRLPFVPCLLRAKRPCGAIAAPTVAELLRKWERRKV